MTPPPRLCVIALAGPNGGGKSTVGPGLLRGALQVTQFLNADVIAQWLPAFKPDAVAITAGRVMRARPRSLARRLANFAPETTLAGHTDTTCAERLLRIAYEFDLLFLSLPRPEFAGWAGGT